MTGENIDRLMFKLAEKYASENEYCFFHYDTEDIKKAFINGFKAGIEYKENN